MPREYRVVWKREGQPRRRRLYQRRTAAKDFIDFLGQDDETRDAEEAGYDPERAARMSAPFEENPHLESREVGEWEREF